MHLFWPAVVRYSVNVNCFWKCLRFKLEKRKVMWMHWFFFSISTFGNLSLSGTDVWLRKFIYAVTFIVFCSNWIFGSGAQCWLAHKVSAFWVEEMDLDDTREIRVNSGQVIGLIMLLLAMLPRDIRSDLVDRLHRMTTQEMVDWYRTSTAASSERAGNSTVDPTSEGEIPESAPPATSGEYISEAEMSEPFGDERN